MIVPGTNLNEFVWKCFDNQLTYSCFKQTRSKPNTMKQRNAFPPNFIHSLDSSHMMLTSLFCQRKSITFASIHDCFWTHACTVDQMNKVIISLINKLKCLKMFILNFDTF